jgi:hypothetical protein
MFPHLLDAPAAEPMRLRGQALQAAIPCSSGQFAPFNMFVQLRCSRQIRCPQDGQLKIPVGCAKESAPLVRDDERLQPGWDG